MKRGLCWYSQWQLFQILSVDLIYYFIRSKAPPTECDALQSNHVSLGIFIYRPKPLKLLDFPFSSNFQCNKHLQISFIRYLFFIMNYIRSVDEFSWKIWKLFLFWRKLFLCPDVKSNIQKYFFSYIKGIDKVGHVIKKKKIFYGQFFGW